MCGGDTGAEEGYFLRNFTLLNLCILVSFDRLKTALSVPVNAQYLVSHDTVVHRMQSAVLSTQQFRKLFLVYA